MAYLLLYSELPTSEEISQFEQAEKEYRNLPEEVVTFIQSVGVDHEPLDLMRIAWCYLTSLTRDQWKGEPDVTQSIIHFSRLTSLIGYCLRASLQKPLIHPDENLDNTQNFLNMVWGEVPSSHIVKLFDQSRIVYAEHGMNNATFTTRVVGSTGADLGGCVMAAMESLRGPLHGGAIEGVCDMLTGISSVGAVKPFVEQALAKKSRVMGFGHRIYKWGDPRFDLFVSLLGDLNDERERVHAFLEKINGLMEAMNSTGVRPNLDLAGGAFYLSLGFHSKMMVPLIILSRQLGWYSHFCEQNRYGKLIRPRSKYLDERL